MGLDIISILLNVITVGVVLFVIFKIKRLYRFVGREINSLTFEVRKGSIDLFRQTVAYDDLRNRLKLDQHLPLMRGWAASPDFMLVLIKHVKRMRPAVIMECGSGVSTVILARCLQLNGHGHVYSLDHNTDYAMRTRELLQEFCLGPWATVIEAPIECSTISGKNWEWYALEAIPRIDIDMLVVDGPPMLVGHLARYPAGPVLFPRLTAGAIVFLDDANREDEKIIVERWVRENPMIKLNEYDCEKGCVSLSFPE